MNVSLWVMSWKSCFKMCSALLLQVAMVFTFISAASAAFGDIYDYGRDETFRYMGDAKIAEFNISEGNVHLDIAFEDTFEEDEMWLFDFQPYEFGGTTPVLTTGIGGLVQSNTGTCSSVFEDEDFDETDGFYKDHFLPVAPGSKTLFQVYAHGSTGYVPKGDIQVRTDHVTYQGDIDALFQCENTNGDNVWEQNVYEDSIEFNTTLYMTNVRPRFLDDGTIAPSYVQSYVVLYWRLLRIAISRFLISSVDRIIPIFEYAVVSAIYINSDKDLGIDRTRAEVEISFWTVTNIQSSDSLISVYKPASLTYTPVNELHGLAFIKDVPDGGCMEALGMESGLIGNSQITTSTTLEGSAVYSGDYARLNAVPEDGVSAGAWFAAVNDVNPFIEVAFIAMTTVTGVITQGQASSSDFWVSEYKVKYKVYADSSDAYVRDEDGNEQVFFGNFDRDTAVTNHFREPLRTTGVRIEPTDTNTGLVSAGGLVAMRMELLGCRDDLPVRLANGGTPYQGRVEVHSGGQWGTVCDDNWTTNSATVVCRQLGYRYAEAHATDGSVFFGEGVDPIMLDDVICDGREASLINCVHTTIHNCDHTEDVGVICSEDIPVAEPSVRLVDGTYHYEGRVEIWHNAEWGTVCDDEWDIADATVVCRELGFADAIEAVQGGRFVLGSDAEDLGIWLDDVACDGDESDLSECTHAGWATHNCDHSQDAGVVCIGVSPQQSVEDMAVLHAPPCNYTYWPGGCTQHWLFTVVLDIDISSAVDRMPIDATGEFEFRYFLYECPDLTAEVPAPRDTCLRLDVPDAIISHEITLQSTVEVTDEERDTPLLQVVNVYGRDPASDLRYNLFQPGVSHLERITVETRFFPVFLRTTLELELLLFMVCIGEEYQDMRDGCLAAPTDIRYSAFTSPEFFYTKLVDQNDPDGATEDLDADSLAGDSSQQELETFQYIAADELHRCTFINKALSAESRVYTITNVFQLVELGTGRRRVVRRDIIENAEAPVGLKHVFLFAGCPDNSTHDDRRDCICNEGLEYSTKTYKCVPLEDENVSNKLPDASNELPSDELDNVIGTNLRENVDGDYEDGSGGSTVIPSGIIALLVSWMCVIGIQFI